MTKSNTVAEQATRKQRTQAGRREESCERILDAAEELFSRRGYHGVTVREIATNSGVDTSLLHYYFGSKTSLFNAVISRRASNINETRLKALQEYEKAHEGSMTAEGVIEAYLTPTFSIMMAGDAGTLNYGALIAKINSTAFTEDFDIAPSPFDFVVQRFIGMLKKVRPECRDAELYWFYHLLSGAITLSLAQTGRIDALSEGACKSSDFKAILTHMTQVFGHGFAALTPPID
ncbi:TetR/AcrR family transcriptional regulator [Kordiimonas pumila]|uniref:TetR/AcrR family transcriptional regulator n=1 Tax=Kordiimonas pumila TaxID=2161677 RepID=A0ABV7D7M9_9PROT|nr:TetR family transcriptional regulator [Kordiimonas pumila]